MKQLLAVPESRNPQLLQVGLGQTAQNFALDGIVSFSTAPLKIWTYVGMLVAVGALGYATYTAIKTLVFGIDVPGYASLLTITLVLGAVQLISIGVVGEYLGRAFLETKRRPLYLVRSTHRAEAEPAPPKARAKAKTHA